TGDYGEREIKNLYVHDNEIRQSGGVMTGLGLGGHDAPEYYTSMGNRWERNTYKTSNAADVRWHWDSGKVQWDPWKSSHPEDGPLN
ncbi:MAG TPA: hypothetical protein VM737_12580, partial [Gemmatimonadota bacterium]|nr:hypothetical protein [Gemmatimonadota bacterium]